MYKLKGDNYGGREVQAVVQLSKEVEEKLSTCKGKVFEVEGTLVSCDAFMRNLFLAEGVLHEKE